MVLLTISGLRWAAFLTVCILFALSTVSAQELKGGWEDIAITEDMVGKSISQIKGSCDVVVAWGAYNPKRPASQTEGKWVRLHWQDDSRTITGEMVGYGLWIYTPENTKCDLQTKGYAEKLGKASRLGSGWNFVSVSKGMAGKSFGEVQGTCVIEKARLYSPKGCELTRRDPDDEGSCVGDYAIMDPESKLDNIHLGKGIWVKVASDCTLDDGTPTDVLCEEAECASKSGCIGNDYKTFGCKNKECVEIVKRECTVEEKAKAEGVNLVPELAVTPQDSLKGGDTMQVVLRVKNTGTKSTQDPSVFGKCTGQASQHCGLSFYNIIYFYKDNEYGPKLIQDLSTAADLARNEIKPRGGSLEVIKQPVKIPEDFSGKLIIVAVVDSQQTYPEAEGGKSDNRQSATVTVRAANLPDLVATEATAYPNLETIPVTIGSITFNIKNTGERTAVAESNFLENKVSVLKGSEVVCIGSRVTLLTIKPSETKQDGIGVKSTSGGPCVIQDATANYRAVVELDTLDSTQPNQQKGVVTESNEDNRFTFQLKGPQTCSPLGARGVGEYCSIATGTWLTQKDSGQQCSHNFECKTDLCVGRESNSKKCISEEKKVKILEIVG